MNSPPAFQFYAADWLADSDVTMMTLEEEGAYIRALAFCWREGSIPADEKRLSVLLKGGSTEVLVAVKQRFKISPFDSQRLVHGRLDLERKKQKEWREKSSEAGKKSGKVRRDKKLNSEPTFNSGLDLVEPKANSSSSSLFSSSSSSPTTEKPKKQNTSSKPKKEPDPRHTPFKKLLAEYWKYKNPANPEMPWDKPEAGQLGNLLKASPNLTVEQFRLLLRNRAKSEVAHGDRVHTWLANITKFSEPINQYGKPKNGNGGNHAAVLDGRSTGNLAVFTESTSGVEREEITDPNGLFPAGENGSGDARTIHGVFITVGPPSLPSGNGDDLSF